MSQKDANCIFCTIAHKEDDTELLYEDEDFAAFKDIKPATSHHYLIIPKVHIKNVKELTYEHKELVEKLVNIGTELLDKQNMSKDNIRLGFHWPPFNSITHLHLHAIGDVDQMSFLARVIFRSNSAWFVTPEYVLDRLEKTNL